MSYIGKNIKKIRTVRKLSQAAFAELFDLARPSVGAYEEGRSEPKIDTLVQISKHFGISVDMLLTKELTINDLYGFDIFKRDYSREELLKKIATPETSPEAATLLVQGSQFLEYIANHQRPAHQQHLQTIQLPAQGKRNTRAFEVTGSEMLCQQSGIYPGDILLCAAADKKSADSLQPGQPYVVVTRSEILIRRFAGIVTSTVLRFRADNPAYSPVDVPMEDILELWESVGVYSTYLKPPVMVEERLAILEQSVQQLNQKLKELGV